MPALSFRATAHGAVQGRRWSHAFAWVLWGATVVLLTAGALVTGTGSSLAVPDWPLAYGRFFPPMVGGILYEHGHRMIAATVGLLSAGLAVQLWLVEPQRWVRALGYGAVGLVVFQGLLGGITVLFLLPRPVSIGHALFAQIFFAVTVLLVQATAPGWELLTGSAWGADARSARTIRVWGLATTAALLAQLVIGATVRHSGAGLAIPDFPLAYGLLIPALESFEIAIHFAHRLGALAVLLFVAGTIWLARESFGRRPALAPLRVPALAMAVLVSAQILLGGAVIWSQRAIVVTTGHLVVGALLLAAAVWLSIRAHALAARSGGRILSRQR